LLTLGWNDLTEIDSNPTLSLGACVRSATSRMHSAAAADIVNFAIERLLLGCRSYGVVWRVCLARLLMRRQRHVLMAPRRIARLGRILRESLGSAQHRQSYHSGNKFLHVIVPILRIWTRTRPTSRSRLPSNLDHRTGDVVAGNTLDRRRPCELHHHGQFLLQVLMDALDTLCATQRGSIQYRASKRDRGGPQGQGAKHVLAAMDATVGNDRYPALQCIRDAWQRRYGRRHIVEWRPP
jgi:hypothetical protein